MTTQTSPTTTTTTTRPITTTTARPTTTTQSSQNATLDDMLLLVDYIQTANINNLNAFDNTYAYIASSDINYRREASDDLLNAYEYLNQAYNMSVKYDNLNVLSGDLKSARDAIGDAMSWDCAPSEVIDKISECREPLEVVADKCMDILDNW